MFEFLRSPTYRAEWNVAKYSPLFEPEMGDLCVDTLKQNLKQILSLYSKGKTTKIFGILRHKQKGQFYLANLKSLTLIHVMLQIIEDDDIFIDFDCFVEEINRITDETSQLEEKERILQSLKTANKIMAENENDNKETSDQINRVEEKKNGKEQDLKLKTMKSEIDICTSRSSTTMTSTMGPESKEIYIGHQIIKPYAVFLLRYISFISNGKDNNNQSFKIWSNLNLLRNLVKVSQCFNRVLRYFGDSLLREILILVQVFNENIQSFYQYISGVIKEKMGIVEMKYTSYMQASNSRWLLSQNLKQMIDCMELNLLKEVTEEILLINDNLIFLYQSRRITKALSSKGIMTPQLLTLTDAPISLLYEVLKMEKECQPEQENRRHIKKSFTLNYPAKPMFLEEPIFSPYMRNKFRKSSGHQ